MGPAGVGVPAGLVLGVVVVAVGGAEGVGLVAVRSEDLGGRVEPGGLLVRLEVDGAEDAVVVREVEARATASGAGLD